MSEKERIAPERIEDPEERVLRENLESAIRSIVDSITIDESGREITFTNILKPELPIRYTYQPNDDFFEIKGIPTILDIRNYGELILEIPIGLEAPETEDDISFAHMYEVTSETIEVTRLHAEAELQKFWKARKANK